jgi:hypothetical protein
VSTAAPLPRLVTLVLCLRDGTVLGSLAPFAAARSPIEASERIYHARDPADWLQRAARLVVPL